jgi:hypothetical protein
MERTTRIPALALALLDSLMPAQRKRQRTSPRNVTRLERSNERLLRDNGIPSFGMLHEPERGYAADLVARYGKLD